MAFAPPPEPGSRIQELGDRLIVRFRPRRAWGAVVFLSFWLTCWTFGGLAAIGAAVNEADTGGRIFLCVWLCGWAVGVGGVATIIAWLLIGRELLTVTPELLEVRKEIGRFARVKRYDAARVTSVSAERFPTDEEDRPRKDFCLMVGYDGDAVRIGEEMGAREAEYVASVVLSRIRPASRWSDPDRVDEFVSAAFAIDDRPSPRSDRRGWVVAVAIALAVVVGGALIVNAGRDRDERALRPPVSAGPPTRADFSNERDYAVAMTRYSLSGEHMEMLSAPECRVISSEWTCTARARSDWGPFAGVSLTYRCTVISKEQPFGRPPLEGSTCGPVDPAPLATAG
jgi:hypothetical protein